MSTEEKIIEADEAIKVSEAAKVTEDADATSAPDATQATETTEAVDVPQEVEIELEKTEGATVATSTSPQEPVSSTSRTKMPSRRPSQPKLNRGYPGSFQNYGLAYLPYKSNFEPSDDARRRADEFLKTLKL